MPQSLVKNYIHIIFSTKHRQPTIHPPFDEELYRYIGGICKNLECFPAIVGGHVDHVHILCTLSKNISIVKLITDIKVNSSKWFKEKDERLAKFYWQNGYGAFSVGINEIGVTHSYILNQLEHHRNTSFEDEYRRFLNRYEMNYDERFVWD